MKNVVGLVCVGVVLSGCALADAARITNAGLPVHENSTQLVDLPLALYPLEMQSTKTAMDDCINEKGQGPACESFRRTKPLKSTSDALRQATETQDDLLQRLRLERAFYAFYYGDQTLSGTAVDRRNRVLQRLVMASDVNCGIFIDRLYKIQSTGNFALGAAATTLGGAGSIVTDVNSARLLAGLSSITSGVRAEANEDFFRKQWIEALAKAVENERNRQREHMAQRKTQTIAEYPVEEAVAEALRYNDACGVVPALKEVNRAVTIADDPAGLRTFRESYSRAGFEAQFNATISSDGSPNARMRQVTSQTAGTALSEIARDLAAMRSRVNAQKQLLKKDRAGEADILGPKIDSAMDRLHDGGKYGEDLASYVTRLESQRDDYKTLLDSLAAADTTDKQREISQLMQANDAAAQVLRVAAQNAIAAVEQEINIILTAQTSTPPAAED